MITVGPKQVITLSYAATKPFQALASRRGRYAEETRSFGRAFVVRNDAIKKFELVRGCRAKGNI
jgi:hypothetical protein